MMPLPLAALPGHDLEILCLGAHSDDIEIGCGGAVLRLVETFPDARFRWVVLSADPLRRREAEASAAAFLQGARRWTITVEDFREGYFPWIGAEIKDRFEQLKATCAPSLIFTHRRDDRHQDHRLVSDLTWNTFRDHLILEYEIPKYDGDLGTPNFYVTLTESTVRRKVETLLECFASQRSRHWFDADTFRGLMRLRGIECNATERFAEGFLCRKASW